MSLQTLAQNAPHKHNHSKQFADDGLDAHAVHTGHKGGNKIDQDRGAAIGKEMLAHLASGDFNLVSVNPPHMADIGEMSKLNDQVAAGSLKVKRLTTSQTAEDGHPRTKGLYFEWSDGRPPLSITYGAAE